MQDEIIVFRQLTKPEVKEIADLMLKVNISPVACLWHRCPQAATRGACTRCKVPFQFMLLKRRGVLPQDVFKRALEKEIKIDVTERFKDRLVDEVRDHYAWS
jgi:hypothetical protein